MISQSCIGFIQHKSNTFCIEAIVNAAPGVPLKTLTTELATRHDVQFFQQYFSHTTLQEYQGLFRQGEWFGLSDEGYQEWQENIRKYPITIEGVVSFRNGDILWSSIQYYSVQNGLYARSALLIKQIGQKWYPASVTDEEQLRSIKGVFRSTRPGFFQYALESTQFTPIPNGFSQVKAMVVKGNTLNADALLGQVKKGLSQDALDNVYYNLKERVHPEADFERDRLHDSELISYMDSLGISAIDQQFVLDQIKSFDYVKAGVRIAQLTNDPVNFPPHIDAIRKIYGDDRIRKAQED
jgi:hypothetical protein